MSEVREIDKLKVKYQGRVVGYLAEKGGRIYFQYDEQWLIDGFSISPFSLPLRKGSFTNSKDTFGGLYGVFADSLPDGWGELIITRKLADAGINYLNLSPLTKLSLVGDRGKGGLSYEPTQIRAGIDGDFDLDAIAKLVKDILEGEEKRIADFDSLYGMMGSSGGARPKAYVNVDGEEWIIKFPGYYDSPDCGQEEYEANELARKCGLKVNEFYLFPSKKCKGYFGCLRFDRQKGTGIHMISLSSLLETSFRLPNLDYLHLFKVIKAISFGHDDLYEAFGRMCFNVLYGNKDDHGHNFAFLYDEGAGGYHLSPFYDITKTPQMVEHQMSVMGKGNPSEDDLLEIANQCQLSKVKCEEILNRIKAVLGK